MKVALLTNEYPPHVYGGAGTHVEYLTRELSRLDGCEVEVVCFGDQEDTSGPVKVHGVGPRPLPPVADPRHGRLMDTLERDLAMAGLVRQADIIHCHTWYTALAGCLAKRLAQAPLVLTSHSLEPHRPWKREQLGTGYDVSSWLERTAYASADGVVAVSNRMKHDVIDLYGASPAKVRVIHNGIELSEFKSTPGPDVLQRYGISRDRPYILFVGRISRQKGILHLLAAIGQLKPNVHGRRAGEGALQVVLAATSPDTPELLDEVRARIGSLQTAPGIEVIWIEEMVPKADLAGLYSGAELFVCPSIYEPFGIINLEAMASETPVVASAVGGIREVVVPGETGLLVPLDSLGAEADFEPKDPAKFEHDLAEAVNILLASPDLVRVMSVKARQRVEEHFSWPSIAAKTLEFYREIIDRCARGGCNP